MMAMRSAWMTAGQACLAEWRAILADRGVLLVFIGAVVIYSLFYPLPYLPQVLREVPVTVVDQDQTSLSRRLIRMVAASELIQLVEPAADLAEAETRMRAGSVGGVLVIPADFQRAVLRGERAVVGAYGDAAYFLVYRQAVTGMAQAAGTLSAGIEVRRLQARGAPLEAALRAREPLRLDLRPLYNPTGGYATYIVPAVLLLILQQTLLIGIGMLGGTAHERGEPATPAPAAMAVLGGRVAAYLALYTVHAFYYFGVVYRIFRFPAQGDPVVLAIFLLPFLLAVILLGITLSSLFRRRETAMQALLFTSLPAVFLAGFSWPAEALPTWLRLAAHLLPTTAGIEGFLRINQMGAGLQDVRAEWLVLWGLVAGYWGMAWWTSRRRGPGLTGQGCGAHGRHQDSSPDPERNPS
jgi:ABC-2 type transport system permease protein